MWIISIADALLARLAIRSVYEQNQRSEPLDIPGVEYRAASRPRF